jgi:D-alanine-D-alanine ligase
VTSGSDDRIRLIVLFGGQSAEHDVSCTTAAHVLAAADSERYHIEAIGITKEGAFVHAGEATALLEAAPSRRPGGDGSDDGAIEPLQPVGPGTELMSSVAAGGDAQVVVLPLLHGPLGEDGTVQGMCELANVAYVGAGVLGSATAMDKAMAKTVLDANGIAQTAWLAYPEHRLSGDGAATVAKEVVDRLGLPCFVKPANMGSSVGVSKAHSIDEVLVAIDTALRYDEWVVIEEAVTAREIEVAVLGNDELELSVPGEIVPGAEFYDYEDKYLDGNAKLIIPAELPPAEVERIHDLAAKAYRALRVEGMARADFLYEEGGRGPLLNELNTIPGFTPISMYPKLWQASGLAYGDLIDRLVDLAIERQQRRSAKRTTARDNRSD